MIPENISDAFEDITIVTTEAAIDVFNARRKYINKQLFIKDVNKGTMISESYYNELLESSNDDIFMESVDDIKKIENNINNQEYKSFRFDPVRHRTKSGILNRKLAELVVSAFEASQMAKRAEGKPNNPLGSLIKNKTRRMDDIIDKLYDGKVISIDNIIDFIEMTKRNPSILFDIVKIGSFGKVKNHHGEIQSNMMEVVISFRIPKTVLTLEKYKICLALDEIDKKCKERNKVKNEKGTRDEKFLELVKEIGDMREYIQQEYGFNTSNSDECKRIRNETCYTEKLEDKVFKTYEVGFHLLKNKNTTPEIERILEKINKKSTTNDDYTFSNPNNRPQIIALAKQFKLM